MPNSNQINEYPGYKKLPDEVKKRTQKKREAEKKLADQRAKEEKKAAKEAAKVK